MELARRIRAHYVDITEDLEPKKHWNYLFQERVLTGDDLDDLRTERTRKARAEKLLTLVLGSGAQNIRIFVESLKKYQPHLYELLQRPLPPERLQRQAGSTPESVEGATHRMTSLHIHTEPRPFVREVLSPVEQGCDVDPFDTNEKASKGSGQHSTERAQPPPEEEQPFVMRTDLEKLPSHIRPGSEGVYPMSSKPRGIALIINIEVFFPSSEQTKKEQEQEQLDNRVGSDKDIAALVMLFEALDFKVKTERNLGRQEILKTLDNIANEDHSIYDCFVLCLMSHGLEGFIFGADRERVLLEDVFGFFSNSRCRTLRGKPKLFIIQACRGRDKQIGVVEDSPNSSAPGMSTGGSSPNENDEVADRGYNFSMPRIIPDHADVLIAYSTVMGYASFRNPRDGSRFVRCLVEVFRESAGHEDVLSMLTMVNERISSMGELNSKQIGQPTSTLTKKLFLWPGM